jgi:hypothetical protein
MAGRWQTARGDEWWFSDANRSMTASFGAGDAVTLSEFIVRGADLTARGLLDMLVAARSEFPQSRIYSVLDATTRSLLNELSAEGRVSFKVIDTGLGQDAEITAINASNSPSNNSLERTREG